MNETNVTIVGNVVNDPVLRTTDKGAEVAHFRVASTARRYDRETDKWLDYATVFLSVNCWRALGVNVVASLRKGDPVVLVGRLSTRGYERDGQPRSSYELAAVAVGPDLARGTASFQRITRSAPAGPGGDGDGELGLDVAEVLIDDVDRADIAADPEDSEAPKGEPAVEEGRPKGRRTARAA